MTVIEEIVSRLKDKTEYSFNVNKESWQPVRLEEYELPEFNISVSQAKGAGGKLKNKLSKVLAFIDCVKHKRYKEGCTVIPISTTSKDYLSIWNSKMGVSNAIAYMIEIGLISIESEKYQFKAFYEKDNISKTYRYYVENERKIKEYCSENGIEKFVAQNKIYTDEEITPVHKDIDKSKVKFSSNLRLIKPEGMSKERFEKELTFCLYENYPALRFFINKANEINDLCYQNYQDFKIKFQPNFSWSSGDVYVSGIGIRATNSMVNKKKEDRQAILDAYGLKLQKDINASVPRMTLSLNTGSWVDEPMDLYGLIFQTMYKDQAFNNEVREAIKKMHMRAYFDSSDDALSHHTWLSINQEGLNKTAVSLEMKKLRQAIEIVEGGKLYNNEIFFVESCVYMMTLYDLVCSGHKVWQVYDCFYSTGNEDEETFKEMILQGVKLNFNEFYNVWWNPSDKCK